MITPLLQSALAPVVARHRTLRYLRAMAAWLVAFAILAVALYVWRDRFAIPAVLLFVALFVVARLAARRSNRWEPDYLGIARTVEERHPDLHALLRTAIEQRPDAETGKLGFLQQRVIAQTLEASRKANWLDSVPAWRLWTWGGAVAALVIALFVLSYHTRPTAFARSTAAATGEAVTVFPGDATIERGSGLVILAKFNRDVPGAAVLVVSLRNQTPQRIPLVKNLDDPVFGGGLPEVDGDLSYRIEYAGQVTRDFSVKVFEHPRLERADATLHFPEYTKLPEKKVPDTRRVSAVEGSKLDVAFQLNKPVKSATLLAKDGTQLPLAIEPDKAVAMLRELPVQTSQTYELRLEDADGRANKSTTQFIVEAVPNRRPELKIATPRGDQRVSPIEEVTFRAEAWDDFGMARYGLTYTVAGQAARDVELGRDTSADERQSLAHLLKLEDLALQPDQLISWFLWAEDIGADGKPRRTTTDMYFAEVRPFEEIYRPGDSQEGESKQQSGQGNKAEKLAELQKQIISATWNLQRAEAAAQPSEKYLKDEPVVRDSQGEALEQATALAEKIENEKSKALIDHVTREMQSASDKLAEAATTLDPLPDALTAEQSAYNALLKLAAHEFRITHSQSKSGRESKGRNQQQLDELEMKEEKKRYETKREAEPQQNEGQREQLAILNRLKELAQRQNDINERVKELQTALQEAKSEQQKEEIRRQLKRLREEEQQLLADLDETRQKMEQSPQQSQLADERKQLEQTRGEAQKAAESMENGETSQALASGTRAQRELQQMRDDLRKKTSGQFHDEMREMRTEARALASNQEQIAEQLKAEPAEPARRTLDGASEREQLAKQFDKQQTDLGALTEDMKRVSEQAEAAEPLLAKELYDALRKTTQAGTGDTLEKTQLLTRRGYPQQARKFEEKARQEIEELKSGVERAAESVLGDEAEAVRQARAELDALTQQLNREIAQGSAPGPGAGEGVPPSRTSETAANAPTPDQGAGGRAPGEVRPGETPGPTPGTGALPGNSAPRNKPGPRLADLANAPRQRDGLGGGAEGGQNGPLTGEKFVEWSDRLRNVEEMLDEPALRTETARIREVAKGVRAEFKRHSVQPNWDMVQTRIGQPLAELRNRLTEELARRESKENLVPIDRDPVPTKYAERVRRYYEELGR